MTTLYTRYVIRRLIPSCSARTMYRMCHKNSRRAPSKPRFQVPPADLARCVERFFSLAVCGDRQCAEQAGNAGRKWSRAMLGTRRREWPQAMLGLTEHCHRHAHGHGSASNLLPAETDQEEKSWTQSCRLRDEYGNVSGGSLMMDSPRSNEPCVVLLW